MQIKPGYEGNVRVVGAVNKAGDFYKYTNSEFNLASLESSSDHHEDSGLHYSSFGFRYSNN